MPGNHMTARKTKIESARKVVQARNAKAAKVGEVAKAGK
jgi:hypothetical protein